MYSHVKNFKTKIYKYSFVCTCIVYADNQLVSCYTLSKCGCVRGVKIYVVYVGEA